MPNIQIKAKVKKVYFTDNTLAYECVPIPDFKTIHCDMHAFRTSQAYGSYANSTLFPSMLKGIKSHFAPKGYIRLDQIPDGVTVDTTGFLAVVSFDVPSEKRI